MQFKSLLVALLFGSAIAAPVDNGFSSVGATKDLPTITGAFSSIEAALGDLDAAVKGLSAGSDVKSAAESLVAKSKAVEAALNAGTTKVSGTTPVSLAEALQVQAASGKLTSLTTQVIDGLISKKDIITKAGQAKVTLDNLTAQKAASENFVKAVTSKVPSAVQSIAATVAKAVGDALAKGITAFSS